MNYRIFGRTGLQVSELTFGAMLIAKRGIENGVSRPLLKALEAGINCIDTARAYGGSEALIARTLKEWKGEKPLIFTKIAPLPGGSWRFYNPLEVAFTPQSIRESVETSLRELEVETLDFVQLHQWYALWTHRSEWLETFQALKAEGKLRFFGLSTQDHEHDAALQVMDLGLIDGVQVIFNVFESRPQISFLPLAQERGLGVIARGIYDHGGLSGKQTLESLRENDALALAPAEKYWHRLERLHATLNAAGEGMSLAELAVRFALTPAAVTTLTLPMHDVAYLDSALASAKKGPLDCALFEDIVTKHRWTRNFWEEKTVEASAP